MSDGAKTILYLGGTPPPALAASHRVLAPTQAGDPVAALAGRSAHVVAEGAAAAAACRLALDHAGAVLGLVLSAPEAAEDALLARLGEIAVPCLLLQATDAPAAEQAAMADYQQRIPRATRILIYGDGPITAAPAWTRLVADFIARGEQFVVNAGAET